LVWCGTARLDPFGGVHCYDGNSLPEGKTAGEGNDSAARNTPRGQREEAVASNTRAPADTFPKLLLRNASSFGSRPAMRHKDLGIWQTWTWAQVRDQVLALAAGLHQLGLKRGDTIAIVGSNRPKLYWAVAAAQALGAIPVPVYADAVADELAFVLAHAEVRFAAVEDQEQVDKILSVSERLPKLEKMVYDESRGLRDYDHANLHPIHEVISGGLEALKDPALSEWLDGEIGASRGSDTSIILYTSGTTGQSKGVVLSAERCIAAASDTVAFDRLTEKDEALAYLPLAWVGDHYLNYAQGMVAGFCMACCETGETSMADLREIGPTFFFAPPRTFEQMLTRLMIRMEDASFVKRKLFHYFIGVARQHGEAILNRQPVPPHGRLLYWLGNILVFGPLKNVLGRAHRLHRRRGHRPRSLFLLPLARAEPEATLRPDRSLSLSHRAAGRADLRRHRGPCDAQRRSPHRRQRRGAVQVARPVRQLLQG
jgi:long-chain acyl-CoA synthetase